jgi:hypothetical protein
METKSAERLTVERLAQLLREAEQAHGEYETQLGHRDEDWPTWYAGYMLPRLQAMIGTQSGTGTDQPS